MKSCQQGKKPLDNKDYWPHIPHVAYKNVIKLSVRGNIGSAESGRTLHKSKFNCSPVIPEYVPEPSLLWIEMECVCVWLAWLLPIHLWVSVDISFSSVQLWVRIRREGSSDLQLSFIFGSSTTTTVVGSLVVAAALHPTVPLKPVVVSPLSSTLFFQDIISGTQWLWNFMSTFLDFGKNWVKMQLNRG